jgi:hypothetical protein
MLMGQVIFLIKKKFDIPNNVSKFNSLEVAKKIKEEYIKIII